MSEKKVYQCEDSLEGILPAVYGAAETDMQIMKSVYSLVIIKGIWNYSQNI